MFSQIMPVWGEMGISWTDFHLPNPTIRMSGPKFFRFWNTKVNFTTKPSGTEITIRVFAGLPLIVFFTLAFSGMIYSIIEASTSNFETDRLIASIFLSVLGIAMFLGMSKLIIWRVARQIEDLTVKRISQIPK